jgi:methylmalonyl-CoA mutase N-terminal domain/subunit
MWARIMRERFGAESPRSQTMRFHTQTGGVTLAAQQPENNIVRVALQGFAAVCGGTQSLHTNGFDEALALPTERSARIALRTQQILAHETGVTRTVDPLGGSYFVEALTDAMEEKIGGIMADLEARGGMVRCIEDGYVQRLIADESAAVQRKVDRGERVIVGVNKYESDQPAPTLQPPEMDEVARKLQLDRLAEVRRTRNRRAAREALGRLRTAAVGDTNLMPPLIDCVEEYCTVGEITRELKDVWGEYQQPTVF